MKRFSKRHSVDKPLTTKYYNSRFGRHSSSSSNIGKPPGYKNSFRAPDGDIPRKISQRPRKEEESHLISHIENRYLLIFPTS